MTRAIIASCMLVSFIGMYVAAGLFNGWMFLAFWIVPALIVGVTRMCHENDGAMK